MQQQQTASAPETSFVEIQSQVSTLTQEVESLRVVVDLRNQEICHLKQSNAELQQQVLLASHCSSQSTQGAPIKKTVPGKKLL